MDLKILVGTKKMCMFYEPAGFWPTIFFTHFLGPLKSYLARFYLDNTHHNASATNKQQQRMMCDTCPGIFSGKMWI